MKPQRLKMERGYVRMSGLELAVMMVAVVGLTLLTWHLLCTVARELLPVAQGFMCP